MRETAPAEGRAESVPEAGGTGTAAVATPTTPPANAAGAEVFRGDRRGAAAPPRQPAVIPWVCWLVGLSGVRQALPQRLRGRRSGAPESVSSVYSRARRMQSLAVSRQQCHPSASGWGPLDPVPAPRQRFRAWMWHTRPDPSSAEQRDPRRPAFAPSFSRPPGGPKCSVGPPLSKLHLRVPGRLLDRPASCQTHRVSSAPDWPRLTGTGAV